MWFTISLRIVNASSVCPVAPIRNSSSNQIPCTRWDIGQHEPINLFLSFVRFCLWNLKRKNTHTIGVEAPQKSKIVLNINHVTITSIEPDEGTLKKKPDQNVNQLHHTYTQQNRSFSCKNPHKFFLNSFYSCIICVLYTNIFMKRKFKTNACNNKHSYYLHTHNY